MDMTAEKVWLCRGVSLALMVGGWLAYADASANWRVDDHLLARGKTTVAMPRKGFDRWLPEESVLRLKGRVPVLKRKKSYTYVAEGRDYENYTTGEVDPVGQTITYLPEDPTVHRLGVIQQRSPTSYVWQALGFAAFFCLPTLVFFLVCVCSSEPTRQGGWVILGLGTAQCALVFMTLFLVRQPFLIVLTLYVPAFVGGTITAILGVRLFAWRWGIKLGKPNR